MMRRTLLLLLFLVPFASALECTEHSVETLLGDQAVNIWLVLISTAVIISIVYMIGKAMGKADLLVFAKDELYHLGFSIMIIMSFGGVLLLSCGVMDFFFTNAFNQIETDMGLTCYEMGTTIEATSTCYVNLAKGDAERMSSEYIHNYVDNLMWSTLSMSIAIPLTDTYTAVVASYKRVISNQYDIILNMFLIPSLVSLNMQQLALGFINNNIIEWLVPVGLLLRVIPLTRQMGNLILALTMGVFILVPYMFTFNFAMYDAVLNSDDCTREVAGGLHYYDAVCDSILDGYQCWSYDETVGNPAVTCSNRYGFWMVAKLVPQAFLLPNLTIALLVALIASLGKAFRVIG